MFFLLLFTAVSFAGDLDGQWRQHCARGYFREESFLGDSAVYTEHNFRDQGCLAPSVDTVSRGALVSGGVVPQPTGARELDFVLESVSLVPRDERAALVYEKISLCGLSGWKAGEAKEITGLLCDLFGQGAPLPVPSTGARKFGIVRVEEDALYFGQLSPGRDGSSELRRPLVLDPSPYRRVH